MRRSSSFAAASSILFLLVCVRPAAAEPITITGGYLDIVTPPLAGSSSNFVLDGTNFDLTGAIDLSSVGPTVCRGTPCAPGTAIDLGLFASGGDIAGGRALYNGATYTNIGSAAAESSASISFAGTATAPPFTGSTTAFVQAPFTFTGTFLPGNAPDVSLTGSGIASLWLTLDTSFGGTSWYPAQTRYDFAVTPEPASLFLVGTGLLGLAGVIRRRARRLDRHQRINRPA